MSPGKTGGREHVDPNPDRAKFLGQMARQHVERSLGCTVHTEPGMRHQANAGRARDIYYVPAHCRVLITAPQPMPVRDDGRKPYRQQSVDVERVIKPGGSLSEADQPIPASLNGRIHEQVDVAVHGEDHIHHTDQIVVVSQVRAYGEDAVTVGPEGPRAG